MAVHAGIRRAGPADAGLLSTLARTTFTEAFGHLYPPQDLVAFLDGAYAPARHRALLADPRHAVFLLEHDGIAVGHALVGPCALPHADVRPQDGELKRLYLVRAHQGRGAGTRLFQAAIDWLEQEFAGALWIGVYSGNPGAQRFYARHGFERVGEYEFPVGRVLDLEYILRRGPSPGR